LGVKTVSFSHVVQKSGQPETHLIFVEPSKDRTLQAAIKANRVMTVQQTAVGTKTDRGEVGFHPGTSRQFLVFPKSLRAFAGRSVVGIKYDLLGTTEIPKGQRAAAPRPPKKKPRQASVSSIPAPKPARTPKARTEKTAAAPKSKVVPFKPAPPAVDDDEDIADLKKQVRHAMAVLEEGKAVAAFNLLKRIVED